MSYLLTQMFLYMLCTFLFGLLLGWLFWRFGGASDGQLAKLEAEIYALKKDRSDLNAKLDSAREKNATINAELETLRDENKRNQTRINALKFEKPASPEANAPVPLGAAFTGVTSRPVGLAAPRDGRADNLEEINGIGPKLKELLFELGYFHFDQIAAWTPSEVAWVDNNLEDFKGRVTRDNWIAQARILAQRPKPPTSYLP